MRRLRASKYPRIGYVDGHRFQLAILSGCRRIIKHEKELNRLNVFPIPDKDTGANLKKTLSPLVESYPVRESNLQIVSQEIADLAVRSALGYSGIIFSQIFVGLAEALKNHRRIYPNDLKIVLSSAVNKAYQSVENPMEGTILSVLREWSEEASLISEKFQDFALMLEISYPNAVSVLKKTPDQLEVLKKNKVVDAGGKALVYFLEGILDLVEKGDVNRLYFGSEFSKVNYAQESIAAPYCVEFCVRAQNLDRRNLIQNVNGIGQDLIFYGAAHFAKLHINTNNPEAVIDRASLFGKISSKKIFRLSHDPEMQEFQPTCLTADSTCDLMDDLIEKNDIYFIPIKIQTEDQTYTDKWDIIPEEFYPLLNSSSSLPKTSQPSLNDFTRIYRHLLLHYRSIISVHLSKALSGTFQTAVQATQNVHPERITVVDGKNLSVGLGLVLLEGIRAISHGKNPKEAEHQIKNAARNTQIFIGLPSLKYLVKGGRITKTKGIIANVLNINPILSIGSEGKLIPVSKARGEKNLEQKIFDLAYKRVQTSPGRFSVAIAHTNAPEIGARIAQKIAAVFGQEAELVMNASPALGAHAGPRAFGIAVYKSIDQSPCKSDNNTNT